MVGIQIATEMLQLPGSTPTPPLAQTAAFGPLPFQKALWSGKDHRIGAGDSASRAVSSELHLSWNLCFLRGSAPGQPSVPVLTPACLPGLRPILSPGVQVLRASAYSSLSSKPLCLGDCALCFGDLRISEEQNSPPLSLSEPFLFFEPRSTPSVAPLLPMLSSNGQ